MKILLANPRGFLCRCRPAIDIVERAIAMFGAPIYVRHEVVHNVHVVDRLRGLGAVFVDELHQVPDGATVIFSAHGVPAAVEHEAARRGLTVFDATCPLVTKVHMEVARYAREARDVVLIGHAGHPEVEGTMGRFDTSLGGHMHLVENVEQAAKLEVRDPDRLAFVTQTTLSVDDTAAIVARLRERFPTLASPRREDICYATQNRQDAVKELIASCDVLLVVGSVTSSNSNRLRELAERAGRPGYLIDDASFLKREWFEGKESVGVTAGASAPEELVQQVVARLQEWGGTPAEELKGREEHVVFSLPPRAPIHPACQSVLTPAIRGAFPGVGVDGAPHPEMVDAELHAACVGLDILARDGARGGGPGQAIVGGAQFDLIEAMRRRCGESQTLGRFAGERRRGRVAGVLTEETVLFGLQRE
jgi:4-hydroxy-3-methylbut-2-enyl diphosphate reductase